MTPAANPNAYLRTKVMTASPAELRLMLFDGAIRFAEQAKTGLLNKDYENSFDGLTKCQAIVMELINALRPEHDPELCSKLTALYVFMYTRLVSAGSERNPEILDEVLKLLRYERETWQLLIDQLAHENTSAQGMKQMPQAPGIAPPTGRPSSGVSGSLIGGTVSLKG